MYRIPKRNRDLRRYVFFKDARRILLYVLWLTLWTVSVILFNQNRQTYPDEKRLTGWRAVALFAAVIIIGFVAFRIYKFFTERTVYGKVIFSGLHHDYTHSEDPGSFNTMKYDFRLKTALTVETANGKKRKLRFEQKIGSYYAYRTGEEILRFHGLSYPINVNHQKGHGYVCVACGRFHQNWQEKCAVCELSLIHPDDLSEIL